MANRTYVILGLIGALLLGGGAWYEAEHDEALVAHQEMRSSNDAKSRDQPLGPADKAFKLDLRTGTATPTFKVAKNDVVDVKVTVGRPGSVIVHGLTEMQVLTPAVPLSVKFRAKFTGRFLMHFHGEDG